MFEQFKFKRIYRTQNDEIDKNLLIPLLQHSLIYDRGTGFFTVDALSDLAKGIIPLIKKKAIIRIITSVELGEKEQILLTKGYQIAEETLKNKIIEDIDSYMTNFEVLATENFKSKEIKNNTKISLGVKIENHLLDIDF